MALIKCSNCQATISDKAVVCPRCGHKTNLTKTEVAAQPSTKKYYKRWAIVLAVVTTALCVHVLLYCNGVYDNEHVIKVFFTLSITVVLNLILTFTKRWRKTFIGLFSFFLFAAIVNWGEALNPHNTSEYLDAVKREREAREREKQQQEETSQTQGQESTNGWTYNEEIDDLTNKRVAVSATLESLNTNPYNTKGDETKLILELRYGKLGFSVQNGVLLCLEQSDNHYDCKYADSFGSGFLAVFDDGEVDESWRLVSKPNKGALVITDSQKANNFIAKLKTANTCKLQVHLDGIGMRTFTFKVDGLKWDY